MYKLQRVETKYGLDEAIADELVWRFRLKLFRLVPMNNRLSSREAAVPFMSVKAKRPALKVALIYFDTAQARMLSSSQPRSFQPPTKASTEVGFQR